MDPAIGGDQERLVDVGTHRRPASEGLVMTSEARPDLVTVDGEFRGLHL